MDKRNIKGQVAMEFMILVGFLLFLFAIISGVIAGNTHDTLRNKEIIIGEDIVTKVQKEVNLAARVQDGYSRGFILPGKLANKDYDIFIVGNEVILHTENQDFWRVIPVVVGNVTVGANTIRKTNGTIYLN
ncbi:hypothetical protein KY366_05730 [Candidatus Woesearchaeota archaeon]|nr:hypothetical protein [Candidatus Woesearchaeota archaeon]